METPQTYDEQQVRRGVIKRFIQIIGTIILMGLVLFAASGDLSWVWAWVYLGIYTLGVIINAFFLLPKNPELVAERGEPKEGVKEWDRKLSLAGALLWLLTFLVAGLDHRFGWTATMFIYLHLLGLLIFMLGNALTVWALYVNAFFSTSVRIQEDRGQTVVSTGPYAFVRHPGYVGMILHIAGLPLLFGSIWAYVPALLMVGVTVIRTSLEDQTLQDELQGYKDYTEQVRYRLLPGIW
jgi:protein-S-isoprenylcysteine O-methyltransferase Ste14